MLAWFETHRAHLFRQYLVDVIEALSPSRWCTFSEIARAVEVLRDCRIEAVWEEERAAARRTFPFVHAVSPSSFFFRHVASSASARAIAIAIEELVHCEYLVYRTRAAGSEAGDYEYALHPHNRLPFSPDGKRARRTPVPVAACAA